MTAVFVTHDQFEAMSLSDEILVLNQGRVMQLDNPINLYNNPNNKFVAKFIGKSNWIDNNTFFRPEDLSFDYINNSEVFQCIITSFIFIGERYQMELRYENQKWIAFSNEKFGYNQKISVYIDKNKIIKFGGENEKIIV